MTISVCWYCRSELAGDVDEGGAPFWMCCNPWCPAVSYRRGQP